MLRQLRIGLIGDDDLESVNATNSFSERTDVDAITLQHAVSYGGGGVTANATTCR